MVKLCQDKYGWEIRDSAYKEVPEPQDKYVFKRSIGRDFATLRNYLVDTYIVNDGFGIDHSARRIFKRSTDGDQDKGKIISWLDKHSKLRGNKLFICISLLGFIKDDLESKGLFKMPEDLSTDFSLLVSEVASYNEMDFKDKIKFVNKLDEIIFKLLTLLS